MVPYLKIKYFVRLVWEVLYDLMWFMLISIRLYARQSSILIHNEELWSSPDNPLLIHNQELGSSADNLIVIDDDETCFNGFDEGYDSVRPLHYLFWHCPIKLICRLSLLPTPTSNACPKFLIFVFTPNFKFLDNLWFIRFFFTIYVHVT